MNTLIIGDSRTHGYGICLKKYFEVLDCKAYPSTTGNHQSIVELVDYFLVKHNPNLLIMITLFEDLIEESTSLKRSLFCSMESFSPITILENIKFYSDRWTAKYPYLRIIWTVPDIPDLVQYNKKILNTHLDKKETVILRKEEMIIYGKLKELRQNFSKIAEAKNVFLLNLRSFIIDEDIEEKLCAFMTSPSHKTEFYDDGVNPKINESDPNCLSELFANKVLELIKKNDLSLEMPNLNSKRSLSPYQSEGYEGTLAGDIVEKLWDRHRRVSDAFIQTPSSYPGYQVEKVKFMEAKAIEMALNNKHPSSEEIADEWSKWWHDKMKIELEDSWLKKKKECLEMLNKETFQKLSGSSSQHQYKLKKEYIAEKSSLESKTPYFNKKRYSDNDKRYKKQKYYDDAGSSWDEASTSNTSRVSHRSKHDSEDIVKNDTKLKLLSASQEDHNKSQNTSRYGKVIVNKSYRETRFTGLSNNSFSLDKRRSDEKYSIPPNFKHIPSTSEAMRPTKNKYWYEKIKIGDDKPNLYNYLHSLLSSSKYLGKNHSVLIKMIDDCLECKLKGLSETKLVTSSWLRVLKEVKYEFKLASTVKNIRSNDFNCLQNNIATLKDLIEYSSYTLRHPFPSTSKNFNSEEDSSSQLKEKIDFKSVEINKTYIDSLLFKVKQYKFLSKSEQTELDQNIQDLQVRDKELALSLTILKNAELLEK